MSKGMMRLLVGALAGMALLLGGCGSSDDTTVTRSEFVRQADAICQNQTKARQAMLKEVVASLSKEKKEATEDEKVDLMLKFIANYEDMTSELADLEAPAKDEDRIEEMIAEMEKAAQKGRAKPEVVITNASYFDQANELALKYGLTGCGL